MSNRTELVATPNGSGQQIKRRKRRISPKIAQAIELIARGDVRTQRQAAERVGVSEEWLCTMLGREETRVLLDQTCRKYLRTGKVRATARLVELLESPSQRTALEASKHVLGIEGISPPRDGTTVNIHSENAGYVIYLARRDEEPAQTEVGPNGGVVYGRPQGSQVIDVTPNADDRPSSASPALSRGYGK